jgi:hypothetical protein
MPGHKFNIGQIVELAPSVQRSAAAGLYQVTKCLPESDSAGEYQYRVKSINEPHERVARESELSKALAGSQNLQAS